MTEQTIATGDSIYTRHTTFTVVLNVTGAPLTVKPHTGQIIRPILVQLQWSCADGSDEELSAEVHGPRVLANGGDGHYLCAEFAEPADIPTWVQALAAQYRGQVQS
jgi:hypothetical protein